MNEPRGKARGVRRTWGSDQQAAETGRVGGGAPGNGASGVRAASIDRRELREAPASARAAERASPAANPAAPARSRRRCNEPRRRWPAARRQVDAIVAQGVMPASPCMAACAAAIGVIGCAAAQAYAASANWPNSMATIAQWAPRFAGKSASHGDPCYADARQRPSRSP